MRRQFSSVKAINLVKKSFTVIEIMNFLRDCFLLAHPVVSSNPSAAPPPLRLIELNFYIQKSCTTPCLFAMLNKCVLFILTTLACVCSNGVVLFTVELKNWRRSSGRQLVSIT